MSGCTGLIGGEVRALLSKSHHVVAVGRREACDVRADFADPSSVARMELKGVEAFVHCAGVVDEDFKEDPARAYLQSTVAMAALLDRCVASGVRLFVYFSTSHVYGAPGGRTDEATPANPLSDYALAHFDAEQIVRRYADRGLVQAVILRPNAVFGVPRDAERFERWGLIPFAFPLEAVTRRRIVLRSTGAQKRNFVGTRDLAACVGKMIETIDSAAPWRVINPLGAETLSVYDFAALCASGFRKISGEPCEVIRPEGVPAESGADFEYGSVNGPCRGVEKLDEFVARITEFIIKRRKNRADES